MVYSVLMIYGVGTIKQEKEEGGWIEDGEGVFVFRKL